MSLGQASLLLLLRTVLKKAKPQQGSQDARLDGEV
jgi:hypothetical protein